MSVDDAPIKVEVTIVPLKGRQGGQRRSSAISKVPDPPRIPRIARLMALAIKFQDIVDSGEVRDYADLARLGLVSRARLTQVMNLLLLAPDIQEFLLCGIVAVQRPLRETELRSLIAIVDWHEQRREWLNRIAAD